jgi:lysine biosynthesis protein LysW
VNFTDFICPACGAVMDIENAEGGQLLDCPACGSPFEVPHKTSKHPPPLPTPRIPRKEATDPWRKQRENQFAQHLANGFDLMQVEYSESNDYPEDQDDPCLLFDGIIFSITGKDKRFPSYQELIAAGLWHDQCLCGAEMTDETLDEAQIKAQAAIPNIDWADLVQVKAYCEACNP